MVHYELFLREILAAKDSQEVKNITEKYSNIVGDFEHSRKKSIFKI